MALSPFREVFDARISLPLIRKAQDRPNPPSEGEGLIERDGLLGFGFRGKDLSVEMTDLQGPGIRTGMHFDSVGAEGI